MLIRKDIRETEPGIDLFLDVQITNVNTCEPMTGVYVDFWMANSTGVYSDIESQKTAVCHCPIEAWLFLLKHQAGSNISSWHSAFGRKWHCPRSLLSNLMRRTQLIQSSIDQVPWVLSGSCSAYPCKNACERHHPLEQYLFRRLCGSRKLPSVM